jgi:hypothetical protein
MCEVAARYPVDSMIVGSRRRSRVGVSSAIGALRYCWELLGAYRKICMRLHEHQIFLGLLLLLTCFLSMGVHKGFEDVLEVKNGVEV